MNYTATELIDTLDLRLRDPSNVAYPRATILNVLNRTQRALNARLGLVQDEATFTTTGLSLYSLESIDDTILRVLSVRDFGRELDGVPWRALVEQDPVWLRRYSRVPQLWSQIGRELLVITPIPVVPTELTVRFVTQTADMLDNSSSTPEIPDFYRTLLLDLTEACLLFRGREFNAMKEVMDRVTLKLGMEDIQFVSRRGTPARTG